MLKIIFVVGYPLICFLKRSLLSHSAKMASNLFKNLTDPFHALREVFRTTRVYIMVTRIVAIRHAKPLSGASIENPPISDEGREVQKRMAELLKTEGVHPSIVLSSPLLRAQQTAQVISDIFHVPFENETALGDDFDPQILLALTPEPEENQTLFLVGHAPSLGNFINALVGEVVLSNGLSKSSAAIVEIEGDIAFGNGIFIKYLQP